MKRIIHLLIAGLMLFMGTTSFTNPDANKKEKPLGLPRWFKFKITITITISNLKNPQNWDEVASSNSDHTTNFIDEIKIQQNESGYIYASGIYANKPKVDVAGQFQDDVLLAAGFGSPAQVQEVLQSDYEIYANSTR